MNQINEDYNEEFWYVFSVAREISTGEFELQCFLEIPPEKTSKISDFIILSKDKIFENCYNLDPKSLSESMNLFNLANEIDMLKKSAYANNAISCLVKTHVSLDREILQCYIKNLKYEDIKKMRI